MSEQQNDLNIETTQPEHGPRIYVASLSDYNAGRLHGAWLDAAVDTADLEREVETMLRRSATPRAEEWAIHDYEGFGRVRLSEYEPLDRITRLAKGIAEHGEAFAAWAAINDGDAERLERFEEAYRGEWPSLEDYAEEVLDDLGATHLTEPLPEWLQPYVTINVAGFAHDLELAGDVHASPAEHGVYIFDGTL